MLELLIVVLPGIFAFLLYRYSQQEFRWKKLLLYVLFYTAAVNLVILAGLKLIGMQRFDLFEMSLSFKIKWIVLEIMLSAIVTWFIRSVSKQNPAMLKQMMRRVFPATLFLVVTYAIFTPSSLFLGNIDEFSLRYMNIVPVMIGMSLFLFTVIFFMAVCLRGGKLLLFYIALIFSIAIGMYVQGNFLNVNLPNLDGTLIDWKAFQTENIISTVFWISCIAVIFTAAYFKKEKFEKFVKVLSYFLSIVQLVSLVVLLITGLLNDKTPYGFSKEGEFSLGSEENIIIFVVDTLQSDVMKEYLASDAYGRDGTLDDFTFYDNAVSGGAPTEVALPLLLTGIEYDPHQSYDAYLKEIWDETQLYDDLHQNGYDVRVYSTTTEVGDIPEKTIDNYVPAGNSWIDDYFGFGKSLYQLVNFSLLPQFLKEKFWLSSDALLYNINNVNYKLNDLYFHNDFLAVDETLELDYTKAYRLYHLNGVHRPYNITENFDRAWDFSVTEQTVLRTDMKMLYAYMDAMKRNGTYDISTIIITGDHGKHVEGNPETNPAVLIKLPMEKHELAYNSAPIHFRNMTATIAGTFLDDYSAYGPAVYDITEASDVERLHTIDDSVGNRIGVEEGDESLSGSRLIVLGDAATGEYRLWDPQGINRIDYSIGDNIDFTANNEYADRINYRLYKENGAATASNELSLCFHLENAEKKDLEFGFVYSDLYNDSQKIRIYAGGSKLDNIVCTRSDIGKEMVTVIPKEAIQDDILTIRMVFPNAVTPNQLDRSNPDMRVLSVAFDSMWLAYHEREQQEIGGS